MAMHMADALLSPEVGGIMWVVSAGAIALCSRQVSSEPDGHKVPLMGVLGAFIFAAQMINFSIPVTGSSGHLGGSLLLAILLGPCAAFLTIASVLVVQGLFFADGGLLALGCNIFNIGFIPALIVYPCIYKQIIGYNPGRIRQTTIIIICSVIGLQLGSFGVVLETALSGISSIHFSTFLTLMQSIHLVIGIVEGCVTATVVSFLLKARPEIIQGVSSVRPIVSYPLRNVLLVVLTVAFLTGGFFSLFASEKPDGLEWSIAKVTGQEKLNVPEQKIYKVMSSLQEMTAFIPDYMFKTSLDSGKKVRKSGVGHDNDLKQISSTSIAGIIGVLLTLGLASLGGYLLRRISRSADSLTE
jgi:cobalt/nickel transport system permease protein